MYARAAEFWQLLSSVVVVLTRSMERRGAMTLNKLFWAAHQRFFKLMLMASKVPTCAEVSRRR